MRTLFLLTALLSVGLLAGPLGARAQANDQLLFVGSSAGTGVGSYNPTGFVTSLDFRYQQPLGANFCMTARTGGEFFRIKKAFRDTYYPGYYSYYGYYGGYYVPGPGSGFSIPVTVGPRYYIVDGLHADLNLGVDIGVTERAATAFRFEPGVGYAIPLANNNYVDLSASFITSFAQGSGAFSFNFAYGLNLGGRRAPAPRAAVPSTYAPAPAPAAPPRTAPPVVPRRAQPRSGPRRAN